MNSYNMALKQDRLMGLLCQTLYLIESTLMDNHRATARQLAQAAIAAGHPLEWFEQLYAKARPEGIPVPWADHTPNPNMIELF